MLLPHPPSCLLSLPLVLATVSCSDDRAASSSLSGPASHTYSSHSHTRRKPVPRASCCINLCLPLLLSRWSWCILLLPHLAELALPAADGRGLEQVLAACLHVRVHGAELAARTTLYSGSAASCSSSHSLGGRLLAAERRGPYTPRSRRFRQLSPCPNSMVRESRGSNVFQGIIIYCETEGRARAPWDRRVPVAGAGYSRDSLRNGKRRTKQTSPQVPS